MLGQLEVEGRLTAYGAWLRRLQAGLDYLHAIEMLHSHPDGPFVMCDAVSAHKLLSQFLISDQLRLLLNDIDALPAVKPGTGGILCGHRALPNTPFQAPEQIWPFPDRPFRCGSGLGAGAQKNKLLQILILIRAG